MLWNRAGIGELLLSFRIPLITLLWKSEKKFGWEDFIGRAKSPE